MGFFYVDVVVFVGVDYGEVVFELSWCFFELYFVVVVFVGECDDCGDVDVVVVVEGVGVFVDVVDEVYEVEVYFIGGWFVLVYGDCWVGVVWVVG